MNNIHGKNHDVLFAIISMTVLIAITLVLSGELQLDTVKCFLAFNDVTSCTTK